MSPSISVILTLNIAIFAQKVELMAPDLAGREQILKVQLEMRRMALSDDVNLARISSRLEVSTYFHYQHTPVHHHCRHHYHL